ncbi:hypothetical protein SAMN04488034_10654 [Salinimicrobium catena]|uniref:Uncharacterized protein n=1 Tax=Salinimicrobium catena TaxID=390640 RepID=A0A1H5NVX3_9FLAO|nr:hypothetical protein [Salinimicrobium catena]SDL60084.1 hypothetical protein SAMN04488140_10660 [Salinimicrobium catena]SEF05600.1 hypothetical protein SAMN04488034_10654 [Salinimicrobium catena]
MTAFKLPIVLLLMTLSPLSYSAEAPGIFSENVEIAPLVKDELSREIQRMLRESELVIEEETKAVLIFNVTPEKKISIRSIIVRDTAVKCFIETRLQNRKLHGSYWEKGEVYAVPVKLEVSR